MIIQSLKTIVIAYKSDSMLLKSIKNTKTINTFLTQRFPLYIQNETKWDKCKLKWITNQAKCEFAYIYF